MKTHTFLIISVSILLRMRNVSDKICAENQNTHVMYNKFFFFENRAFYEQMSKNIVDPSRPQITIWRFRFAYWIPKVTNTHSKYVIIITFPLQQWLHERASVLCYTYSACRVITVRESVYFSERAESLNKAYQFPFLKVVIKRENVNANIWIEMCFGTMHRC